MECRYCKGCCVKAGVRSTGVQKYRCRSCKKYQQKEYSNRAYSLTINRQIGQLVTEGIGIRGIARILRISITTVIRRIKQIGKAIDKPFNFIKNRIYEIDELWTYV